MDAKNRASFVIGFLFLVGIEVLSDPGFANDKEVVQRRHPVAIAVFDDGQTAAIANHRSGSISVIDVEAMNVVHETRISKELSDLVKTSEPARMLATDETSHQLIAVRLAPDKCVVERRLDVSPYPVRVRVDEAGKRAFVASLWSRTITVVDLEKWLNSDEKKASDVTTQVRLPFSPGQQLVIDISDRQRMNPAVENPRPKLLVADAFGSKLAVIDPDSGTIDSIREIPGHAIRGMQLHPSKPQVVITHQLLSRLAHTSFDDVHWGALLANCVRSIELGDVLDSKRDLLKASRLEYVGGPERGAGDPAGIAFQRNGKVLIAISGTDELLIDGGTEPLTKRVKTGAYPTTVVTAAHTSQALVVNTLDDSISVISLEDRSVKSVISLGPRPDPTDVDRGERLFHSARLSHDGWFSCASCHVDGHSNGLLNDNFTDGSFGTPKRVLTLRGVTDTAPYAWTGRFPSLADQITHSIKSTMQGNALEEEAQALVLEAYIRSLPPIPSVSVDRGPAFERGRKVFDRSDCRKCHTPPTYTSEQIVDVQLKDEQGVNRFNPPSLRGVSHTGPWLHDGRAKSLESVFTEFRHQIDREMNNDEIADLVMFLKCL